jgi:DNA-binding helix-hairpin-helix protein with protein kinase domain
VSGASSVHAVAYLDIAAIERHLAEVPSLDVAPFPLDPNAYIERAEPLPPRLRSHRIAWRGAALASVAASGAVGFGAHAVEPGIAAAFLASALLYAARPPLGRIRTERRRALDDAERAYEAAAREWREAADLTSFARTRDDLRRKLEIYRGLPAKFTAEYARLETDKRRYQERAYLETFLLNDAKIAGIGRKRRETLAAYGIETAHDVDELLPRTHVPGFGETKRALLRMWVEALRRRFTYDPTMPLDPSLRNELQARENRERSDLERELRGGPQALKLAVEHAIARRDRLREPLEAAARALAKARADLAETALG